MALGAALAGAASPLASAQPQEPSGQKPLEQAPAIRTQVTLINVFATVRDKSKRIVSDLTEKDFRVFEDNQEQKIAFFSRETALPITLGVLLDTSGSEERMLGAIQESASRFLERVLRPKDLAMVISFDVDVDLLSDFTEDRGMLERAIQRARINAPQGGMVNPGPLPPSARGMRGTAFYDAIYVACREKLASEAGRKALVIITDAVDMGSKVKLEEAIEMAQRTDTVIHILLTYDPYYGADSGVGKKIAEETGGRMIEVRSEKKLQEAFDQISEELRTQYLLGYYPSNTERDGRFRKIKVEVPGKDMKVLARKGYYAPKS
jgi:VWFA-related protein